MVDEMTTLRSNDTSELVPLFPSNFIASCKCVVIVKMPSMGIVSWKAWLMAKGNLKSIVLTILSIEKGKVFSYML